MSKDLVKVVRCKDCIHYQYEFKFGSICFLLHLNWFDPTDYCSQGERKDNGEV